MRPSGILAACVKLAEELSNSTSCSGVKYRNYSKYADGSCICPSKRAGVTRCFDGT